MGACANNDSSKREFSTETDDAKKAAKISGSVATYSIRFSASNACARHTS